MIVRKKKDQINEYRYSLHNDHLFNHCSVTTGLKDGIYDHLQNYNSCNAPAIDDTKWGCYNVSPNNHIA